MRDERRSVLTALGLALAGLFIVHYPTFGSMVEMWLKSETFLHCFVIAPISAYLVWRRWPQLRGIGTRTFYPGLLGLAGVSLGWWLSDFLGIQVGKQLMAVSMIPLTVLTIAGPAFTRSIAFPLGYLFFAVPFGVAAIPYLIDFTAFFTVKALQLTGIPVIQDGPYFSIPAGDFEVAKACSGIRYILASLAIGTLYGYLIFESHLKRLAFFAFALVLPIVANGVRAYGIVLLAHYSDMKLAVGVDHLIYGWLFFGVVMLAMFWIGNRFHESSVTETRHEQSPGIADHRRDSPGGMPIFAVIIVLAIVASAPAASLSLSRAESVVPAAALPLAVGEWRVVISNTNWQPDYSGATHALMASYEKDGRTVDLAIYRYDVQRQGSELANVDNAVFDAKTWRFAESAVGQVDVGASQELAVRETVIYSGGTKRLVWSWHEVNGAPVKGDFETKLEELLSVLVFKPPVSAAVITSVLVDGDEEAARATLRSFIGRSIRPIRDCLYALTHGSKHCLENGNSLDESREARTANRGVR